MYRKGRTKRLWVESRDSDRALDHCAVHDGGENEGTLDLLYPITPSFALDEEGEPETSGDNTRGSPLYISLSRRSYINKHIDRCCCCCFWPSFLSWPTQSQRRRHSWRPIVKQQRAAAAKRATTQGSTREIRAASRRKPKGTYEPRKPKKRSTMPLETSFRPVRYIQTRTLLGMYTRAELWWPLRMEQPLAYLTTDARTAEAQLRKRRAFSYCAPTFTQFIWRAENFLSWLCVCVYSKEPQAKYHKARSCLIVKTREISDHCTAKRHRSLPRIL